MADALKGLLSGMNAGHSANAARAKAAQERADKNRSYALDLAGESRLVQGAAEGAMKEMEDLIASPNWDPSMTVQVLQKAKRFDATYGRTWAGGSAQSKFAKLLHVKDIGPNSQGKQGPSSPEEARGGKLSGFTSELQKQAHKQKIESFAKEEALEGLQLNGMQFLRQHAVTDGFLDPNKVGLAMLDWESQAMASGNYDVQDMMAVTKAMREQLKPIIDEMIENDPNSAAYKERREQRSKDTSKWVRDQFTKPNQMGIDILNEGHEQIRNVVEEHGQQMVMLGYDMPVIKAELLQRFTVGQKWVVAGETIDGKGMNITPHQAALAEMPRHHLTTIQDAYDNGYMGQGIDPVQWEPVHNPDTGETYLFDQINDQEIPLVGPNSPVGSGPRAPVAPTQDATPVPKEQQTGSVVPDKGKEKAPYDMRADFEKHEADMKFIIEELKKGMPNIDSKLLNALEGERKKLSDDSRKIRSE